MVGRLVAGQPSAPDREVEQRRDSHRRPGGGIYALSFKVASLEAARGYLESKGLRIAGDSERRVVIEPNDTGGSTFMMVEQELA